MQIGDLKVADSIITLEVQMKYIESVLNYIIENNKGNLNYPNQKVLNEFSDKALKQIQSKYPHMGIKKSN